MTKTDALGASLESHKHPTSSAISLSIYATLHVPQLTAGLCGTDTKQSGTREKAQKKKKKNEKLHQNLKKKKKILTRPMNGTFLQRNK